jgi:cytochrome b561
MKWLNSTERYGLVPIVFHWLILFLFLAVYASIELREVFPKGSEPREALKSWHFMLGILIFLLLWPRLISLRQGYFPSINPEQPYWQKLLSRGMHLTLYGLMFLMPLTGWLLLSAEAKPIPFFALHTAAALLHHYFFRDNTLQRILPDLRD